MEGDERVRHCGECGLNVYNLSAMTEEKTIALVAEREGRMCVRFFEREDGTVLTEDCPVGGERGVVYVGELEPPDFGRL